MTSFSVRQVRSSDERQLSRWLAMQKKLHTKFSANDLSNWLATRDGFLAEHATEPVGFLLYTETSRENASIISLAVGDRWDEGEILTILFQKALPVLRRREISTLTCVTAAKWAGEALRRHLNFNFRGNLASYLKVDWHVPEFASSAITIRPASTADGDEILHIDRAAFPPLWQQDEHAIFTFMQRKGFLLKAEWQEVLVGYTAGIWKERCGHINRLAVHPQVQGQGIGKRLLAESISHFHQIGIHRITLNTQVNNTASRQLYEQFGFQVINCNIQVLTKAI